MEKLKAILAEHCAAQRSYYAGLNRWAQDCRCGVTVWGVDVGSTRHALAAHQAEVLKPLLAEVWEAGWDNRDRYEFEPWDTTNPYEESK